MANDLATVYGSVAYATQFRPECEVEDSFLRAGEWNQKISTVRKDMKLLLKVSLISTLVMGIFATCLLGLGLGAFFFSAGTTISFLLEPGFFLSTVIGVGALSWIPIWRRELSQMELKIDEEVGTGEISYKDAALTELVTAEEFSEIAHFFGCEKDWSEEDKLSYSLNFKSLPYEKTYRCERSGGKLGWFSISPISIGEKELWESKEQEIKNTYRPWFDLMLDLARSSNPFMRPEDREQIGQAIVQLIYRPDQNSDKINKKAFFQRQEKFPSSISCYCSWETDKPFFVFRFPCQSIEFLKNPSAQDVREILKSASFEIPLTSHSIFESRVVYTEESSRIGFWTS